MPYYSVPTSPVMARSTSNKSQPVTPQRPLVQRTQHRHSISQPLRKSPATSASPYTPLSLRSFTSSASGGSPMLTTPDRSSISTKRLPSSPLVVKSSRENSRDRSLADITENWRARASENGIKVSSVNDDSHFGDDEASERTVSDAANDSKFLSTEDALLAPSLIVDQRRSSFPTTTRSRARSHVPLPTSRVFSPTQIHHKVLPLQPVSPLVSRSLNLNRNANSNVISTPPPNRSLARQLRMKGCFTDPAQTRRRETFGPLLPPSQDSKSFNIGLPQDTSLDLFDIDENDFENDSENSCDYNAHLIDPNGSSMELEMNIPRESTGSTISFEGSSYRNYTPPPFHAYALQHPQGQSPFLDVYSANSLGSMTENVEHLFHTQQFHENMQSRIEPGMYPNVQTWGHPQVLATKYPALSAQNRYKNTPAWVPIPAPPTLRPTQATEPPKPAAPTSESKKAAAYSGCSVCLAPSPPTLAVLIPCSHPLCSGCLTSALNIVGEKDMECAVCRDKVLDFRLLSGNGNASTSSIGQNGSNCGKQACLGNDVADPEPVKSFVDLLSGSSGSDAGNELATLDGLEGSFEFGLDLEMARASTPKRGTREDSSPQSQDHIEKGAGNTRARQQQLGRNASKENVVLRIDNVPWDITPPQIQQWIQQPLEHVHVLLDKRGKTMSHAYIEVADLGTAGKILRGEVGGKSGERGSVLGKGKRARGVTITRCGQEELMADLFPTWKGSFDSSRPSLAGLGNEQVISALGGGLISESEVIGLLHLVKEPDSQFLKAPSLPYHLLISILSKFPTDVDSRVFWSAGVRDLLYDVTYAAVQILRSRLEADVKLLNDKEYSMELAIKLAKTASNCTVFTNQQMSEFTNILESCSSPAQSPADVSPRSQSNRQSESKTTETRELGPVCECEGDEALAELAREFGVEAPVLQALAQRLAGLKSA